MEFVVVYLLMIFFNNIEKILLMIKLKLVWDFFFFIFLYLFYFIYIFNYFFLFLIFFISSYAVMDVLINPSKEEGLRVDKLTMVFNCPKHTVGTTIEPTLPDGISKMFVFDFIFFFFFFVMGFFFFFFFFYLFLKIFFFFIFF
jgi:hypothetical protein